MTHTQPVKRKRFKWEPPALMVLVCLLGVWLVWARRDQIYGIHPRDGAHTMELRVGNQRGVLEATGTGDEAVFRVLFRNGFSSRDMTRAQVAQQFGERVVTDAIEKRDNTLFRLFNITTWTSLVWVLIGLGGQVAFSGRMLVQWIVSEKERKSVIPTAFWWLSLFGGLALFAYFVWRQDFIGVLGQSSGIVIYARNLRLIAKQRRRMLESTDSDRSSVQPST